MDGRRRAAYDEMVASVYAACAYGSFDERAKTTMTRIVAAAARASHLVRERPILDTSGLARDDATARMPEVKPLPGPDEDEEEVDGAGRPPPSAVGTRRYDEPAMALSREPEPRRAV